MSTLNPSNPAPGVYTKIVDLSDRPSNVATSIGAFIGASPRGPVNERTLVTDYADFTALFGQGGSRFGYLRHCLKPFMEVSSRCYVTRLVNGALTAGAYLTADDMNAQNPQLAISVFTNEQNQPTGKTEPYTTMAFTPTTAGGANILGFFCAANPGAWNNTLTVQVRPSNPSGVSLRGNGHDPLKFWIDVFENKTSSDTAPSESFLVCRHEEKDEEGNSLFVEDVVNESSNLIRFINNEYAEDIQVVSTASVLFAGGTDGAAITNDQIVNAWDLYDDPEEISVDILVNCGYTNHNVQHKMELVARTRGDSIAILDVPADKEDVADAINYKRNILNMNSKYAALYTPRVNIYDSVMDKKASVPISGWVAASFARADRDRALWFAPAGIELGSLSVLGTTTHYDQGGRDAVDLAQINPVRKLPGNQGYVIWGQQTTQTQATSLQYVNVMRLTQFILKQAKASVLQGVFNPNDSLLRDKLRGIVQDILEPIKRGRGIYEYEVICDERNNTSATIANGDLVMDIVYDPTIATKRVHVTFNLNPTGSTATEN